jgi:hypothetical protein
VQQASKYGRVGGAEGFEGDGSAGGRVTQSESSAVMSDEFESAFGGWINAA